MKLDGSDPTVRALQTVLGQESRRAQVVASNLVNFDTPGYRALDVEFLDYLPGGSGLELQRGHAGHLSPSGAHVQGRLIEAPYTRTGGDGNTVDIDREMTRLAMAAGRFRTTTEMLRKRFALLVYTASDGRS